MEKSLQELVEKLITVPQRDYFVDSIDVLISSLYSSHQTIFELTSLSISLPYSDLLVRMYHEQNLLENDKDGCKAILNTIKKTVTSIETIELRVAFNMTEADVKDIKNWFFYQLKRQMLLNIIVDPSLIGGLVIYRNGIYKDYSVAAYIDRYGTV
jgi:hypothetical protein